MLSRTRTFMLIRPNGSANSRDTGSVQRRSRILPFTIPSIAFAPISRHSRKYGSARVRGCASRFMTRSSWYAEKSAWNSGASLPPPGFSVPGEGDWCG